MILFRFSLDVGITRDSHYIAVKTELLRCIDVLIYCPPLKKYKTIPCHTVANHNA